MSALCQISNNPNMKELSGLCQPGRRPVSYGAEVGGFAPTALISRPAFPKIRARRPNPGQNKREARTSAEASASDMTTSQRLRRFCQEVVGWWNTRFGACRRGQRCFQVGSNLVQVSTGVQSLCFLSWRRKKIKNTIKKWRQKLTIGSPLTVISSLD